MTRYQFQRHGDGFVLRLYICDGGKVLKQVVAPLSRNQAEELRNDFTRELEDGCAPPSASSAKSP
jgi:hypothetical protein